MSDVVAIMSMSLDGFVAGPDDDVMQVFDWYFASGDVEFATGGSDPMTFRVSEPSAEYLRELTPSSGPSSPDAAPSRSPRAGAATTRGAPPSSSLTTSRTGGPGPGRPSTS